MIIKHELNLYDFEPWGGAINTLQRIIDNDKANLLQEILDDAYPDGMTEDGLNDLLAFNSDWIYEMVGLKTEESIRSEISDKQQEIEDLKEEYESEAEDLSDEEREELYQSGYARNIEELEGEIDSLKEELENL